MQLLLSVMLVAQMLSALAMIFLVLIQHGKGADMGASFGSGASGSLFGATGSANFLSRSTAVCAAIFFACTLALAYFGNLRGRGTEAGSVLDRAVITAPAASAAASAGMPASATPSPASIPNETTRATIGATPTASSAASSAVPAIPTQ